MTNKSYHINNDPFITRIWGIAAAGCALAVVGAIKISSSELEFRRSLTASKVVTLVQSGAWHVECDPPRKGDAMSGEWEHVSYKAVFPEMPLNSADRTKFAEDVALGAKCRIAIGPRPPAYQCKTRCEVAP